MIDMINPSSMKKKELNSLRNHISVILVEPSKPQNLGSIARGMMNFGFENLIIINPQLELANPEIEVVARRANYIINQAQLVTDLNEIRESFDFLIGTTARVGGDYNLKRVAVPPERLLNDEFDYEKIGIVFGKEQSGLSNEEIALCDLIITIPTHESYPVLNLSHAVTIILYFLFQKLSNLNNEISEDKPKHRAATYRERKQILSYYEKLVESTSYHPEKRHVALQAFSNIISRGYVTGRELTTLMGVFKWIELNLEKKS